MWRKREILATQEWVGRGQTKRGIVATEKVKDFGLGSKKAKMYHRDGCVSFREKSNVAAGY